MPLQIIRQDITKMRVDAIVNTTNEEMVGYSGVDLAVHTVAGAGLDEECLNLPPLSLGQAVITGGYNLPSKYVIHTSGPIWRGGNQGESVILRSCYMESLKLAVKHKCKSVAFPLISAGVYCYPKDQVLKFAIQTITEFFFDHELMVYICVFDRDSYTFSQKLFNDIKALIDDDYVDERDEEFYLDRAKRVSLAYSHAKKQDRKSKMLCDMAMEEVREADTSARLNCSVMRAPAIKEPSSVANKTLDEYMLDMDKSFAYKLFELIDKKGMTDVECYKKANVDKKTFSKIKCNPDTYKPSKQTAVAFAIALKLDLDATQDLLASAGLTLSRSFTFDKIIRYFIQNGNYDIFEINEALFHFDQQLLGV